MLRGRPQRSGPALAAAAVWILASEPEALFQVGAQLSFCVVAALSWAPRSGATGRGAELLARTLVAALAAAPILAWHGLETSRVTVLANLLLLPWVGAALLPAALLSSIAIAAGAPRP